MAIKLNQSDVEHVARLARLDSARLVKLPVASGELTKFGGQLGKIVEYVDAIGKVKSQKSKVKTTIQNSKVLREDQTGGECLTQEAAVAGAKNVHNGLFVVPAIFKE